MAVAAGVVPDAAITAAVALLDVAAEGGGAALLDGRHHAALRRREGGPDLRSEGVAVAAEEHPPTGERGAWHGRRSVDGLGAFGAGPWEVHSVRIASAARIREMAAPRRHLALVCFLHHAWRDHTRPGPSTCTASSSTAIAKRVEDHLDDRLKAQRHAVDRIVHRYHRLGAVLLDPDIGDAELRTRLLSIVPETQLREDQSALANWTLGDRQARFEQTAARHAGLSQFRRAVF